MLGNSPLACRRDVKALPLEHPLPDDIGSTPADPDRIKYGVEQCIACDSRRNQPFHRLAVEETSYVRPGLRRTQFARPQYSQNSRQIRRQVRAFLGR